MNLDHKIAQKLARYPQIKLGILFGLVRLGVGKPELAVTSIWQLLSPLRWLRARKCR